MVVSPDAINRLFPPTLLYASLLEHEQRRQIVAAGVDPQFLAQAPAADRPCWRTSDGSLDDRELMTMSPEWRGSSSSARGRRAIRRSWPAWPICRWSLTTSCGSTPAATIWRRCSCSSNDASGRISRRKQSINRIGRYTHIMAARLATRCCPRSAAVPCYCVNYRSPWPFACWIIRCTVAEASRSSNCWSSSPSLGCSWHCCCPRCKQLARPPGECKARIKSGRSH